MRTIYYDMNDITAGAIGVFMRDTKVLPAGVTISSESAAARQDATVMRAFAQFARKDVHFIFRDEEPEIDFYAVPRLDVFARTSEGLLATLGESSDPEGGAPIVLIDREMNVRRAARNMMDLLTSTNWKDGVGEERDVKLYSSREAAEAELEFIQIKVSSIRRARPGDVARLAEIEVFNYRLNFYPIFRNDGYYFDELQVPAVIQQYIDDESLLNRTFVFDDGVVKGFIRVNDGEVEKLFVEPALQGQSIGGNLLEFAIAEKNARSLWALEKNERAIAFYLRYGFRITGGKKLEEDTTEYLIRMER